LYAEIILRGESSSILEKGKLIELDAEQKKILEQYIEEFPYIVVLIGHYGTGKTLIILQMMAVRIGDLIQKGKRIRVIVTADVSNDSLLLQGLKEKYLKFIENINAVRSSDYQIELIVEPLNSLIKRYAAVLMTLDASNQDIIKKISELSLLDTDGWLKDGYPDIEVVLMENCDVDEKNPINLDDLVAKLKKESDYHGETTADWLTNELCYDFPDDHKNPVTFLRLYRQQCLFKVFQQEYFKMFGTSYILDKLLPCLVNSSRHWNQHTLLMIDEFNAFDAPGDWTPNNLEMYQLLKLDVFIAVEPLSWSKFNHSSSPKEKNNDCIIKFLPTKHRNCEQIDKFIAGSIRETGELTKGNLMTDSPSKGYLVQYVATKMKQFFR
jgi:hypothetical protein